jgi:phage terminase large subunit GpA-like protein
LRALRRALRRNVLSYLKPPPKLTVSEWADRYRVLSREYAAEPGQWRTDRAPYQRGIMDAFADPEIQVVVVESSSQVGKSEIEMNVLGFFTDQDPSPVLIVHPTVGEAEQWSKTRLAPTIRDTPRLRKKIKDARSRDSGNTLLIKEFPGGHLTLVGANAPSGLAAKPIRVLLCDEVDRFPASAGTEGDPIAIATRRTQTFWNRKIALFSTPTLKGLSRIEKAFAEGDQRYYLVPCPHCGYAQRLVWKNLRWEPDHPATATYECVSCTVPIPERHKAAMLAAGHWEPTAPLRNRTASFHLSALYSAWVRWEELAREWIAAQGDVLRLQVFVNTILGETWEDRGGGLEPADIGKRREPFEHESPAGVGLVTMGVDVQADRLEYLLRGWGVGEESWLCRHGVIVGDPAILPGQAHSPWDELDSVRREGLLTPSGKRIPVSACGVDTGFQADEVYAYCRPRFGQRVYAMKGSSTTGRPILPRRPSVNNRGRVRLFEIGTEAAKDVIYARLRMTVPGPQYMHLPEWVSEDYLEQVTAEKVVRHNVAGRWSRRYELARGKRNEALDLEVLALAAYRIVAVSPKRLAALVEAYQKLPAPALALVPPDAENPEPPEPPNRPRKSWVRGW